MKKYIKPLIFTVIIMLLIGDRLILMPNRVDGIWSYCSGTYLGDPIGCKQDFLLSENKIIFTRNKLELDVISKKNIYLLGIYFGYMYMYDNESKEVIIYSRY